MNDNDNHEAPSTEELEGVTGGVAHPSTAAPIAGDETKRTSSRDGKSLDSATTKPIIWIEVEEI